MIELNASLIWYLNSGGEVQMNVKMGAFSLVFFFFLLNPKKQHQMASSLYSTDPAHTEGAQVELDLVIYLCWTSSPQGRNERVYLFEEGIGWG